MRLTYILIVLSIFVSAFRSSPGILVLDFKQLEFRLSNYNDTTYIINFWATWCIPCRKELPDFERINADYLDERVKVLLVSLDFPNDIDKSLIPFIYKYNIKSEVVVLDDVNSNYWISQVDSSWNGNIPATLIYNRNYRDFFSHLLTYENLDSILKTNIIKL